jgi:hypothetical protein
MRKTNEINRQNNWWNGLTDLPSFAMALYLHVQLLTHFRWNKGAWFDRLC